MDDKLKKVVELAIGSGWLNVPKEDVLMVTRQQIQYHPTFPAKRELQIWVKDNEENAQYLVKGIWSGSLSDLAFNPDFAKAIWGEKTLCPDCGKVRSYSIGKHMGSKEWAWCGTLKCAHYVKIIPAHHYHMQQMCLLRSEDRLDYMVRTAGGRDVCML